MKKYVLGLCLIICSLSLFAQKYSISGSVTDEKGNPLAGTSIIIKNSYLGTFSDAAGTYALDKIAKGTYTVIFSYIGYTTIEKSVTITNNVTLNLTMSEKAIHMEPVIITAIKAKEMTPFAKTNISKSEIEEQNLSKDIPYELEQTPSVVATSDNGTGMGYTGMRIRGTDMSRINVTVNGIPLNDAESQGVFWVNMADFASSVEEVQIQRGVGTSTNGAASFGASVNFQTIDIQEKPHAQVSSTVGSFHTFKENISAGTGIMDSCWYFGVRASKLNSDGWVQRGFSDHQSMHATGSYFKGNHMLTANVLLGKERTGISWEGLPSDMLNVDRTYNVTGLYYDDNGNERFYDNETDNYWQNHYSLTYNANISKSLKFSLTGHATTGKGYYEQYKDNAKFKKYGITPIKLNDTLLVINDNVYVFPDSTISSSDLIRQKWMDNIFYGYTTSLNYSKNNITISLGSAYNIYSGDHFGKIKSIQYIPIFDKNYEWYTNESEKKDFNIFTKVQYNVSSHLSIYGDIQYRNIQYTMNGIDDDFSVLNETHVWDFVNPKAGLFYKIDKQNNIFASFAVANREPTRADLKDASKSDKQVTSESLYDFEAGYQLTLQKMGFAMHVYNMKYDNQLVLTGKLNDVGDPIMENVKNSFRRGVEFTLGIRPVKEIAWNTNLTLSQNKILDYIEYTTDYDEDWNEIEKINNLGTTDISYSPNVIASNSFIFYPDKTMSFGITSKHVGAQYFDNTSDETRKLNAYTIHNFQLNYSIPFEKSKLQLQLLVNNFLDTKYISNAYGGNWFEQGEEKSWMYYFPQAGINYMCKATFDF